MELLETTVSNEVWSSVWQTFANISQTYDLVSSQNGTKGSYEDNFLFDNPAKLGILTGLLLACIADFKIAAPKLDVCLDSNLKTMAITIINLISFLLLLPFVSGILIIFFIYRKIIQVVLRFEFRKDFVGLLEGTDCIWAVEETTALSVINALAILETNNLTTNENFLLDFRNMIKDRLISSQFEKLNWLREKKYGYYFWRRSEDIGLEERVRWFDENENDEICDRICDDITGDFLNNILAKVTNKSLPREHATSWEILIGKSCPKSSSKRLQEMEEGLVGCGDECVGLKRKIPVLFRVHHSLGDGVALLRLLLESIADLEIVRDDDNSRSTLSTTVEIPEALEVSEVTEDNQEFRVPLLYKNCSDLGTFRDENEVVYYANDLLSACMPFTTRIQVRMIIKSVLSYMNDGCKFFNSISLDIVKIKITKQLKNTWIILKINYIDTIQKKINKMSKIVSVLISIPSFLIQQNLRSMDNSALHGPKLSGKKMISYWMESDVNSGLNSNLLSKIRDIKDATGTRFGDVILAALSANFHRYFSKIGEAAPKNMTVVIPARMTAPSKKLSLRNEFSVGLLPLCISEVNGELVQNKFCEDSRLLERLSDISRSSEKLRNDPDYLINLWVMKWLSAALPEFILKAIIESHSTLVFSNLPGPQKVTILGHKLKNVAFWIPHRGTTGIGCSLLTYAGKVHVSLVADEVLVRSQKLLDEILINTVQDIENLYDTITLSCFAMNLKDRLEAPTETGHGVLQ